ncbi:hypothetical protein CDD81_6273 [Ophiocordyceps australis]|uniref:DUF7598 domain-containing protein n=1 Tax=Ophiocordyceps australis TaxID=1399860 RepID=A0A2C5Y796_9HYPO|nr:hypothetical protein CDD81_6273 [Ophiocordyceps australis]
MANMGTLRGAGMVILQILRAFTVITLAAVEASCWVLMIKVDKGRSFFVFECASLFFTAVICLFLIVAEFPLIGTIKGYLSRTWPVLSDQHGLAWLGTALVVIGCNMLGNLNRPAYDADNLGPHFARLVLASAILALTFGILNIVSSYVWRDTNEAITSRDIRANGSLAKPRNDVLPEYTPSHKSNSSSRNEKTRSKFMSMFWRKGTTSEKSPRPKISGPMPIQHEFERHDPNDRRGSPIVPGVRRPDTALHPMHAERDSIYSEAHLSRF